jgi:putative ABC transport system permease protein
VPREPAWLWFGHELLGALRSLWGSPLYALPAIVSLALGIGASTAAFAVFNAMVLRPLPFPREAELVTVGLKGIGPDGSGATPALSPAFAADFRELSSVFASFSVHQPNAGRLTSTQPPRRIALESTTLDFFDTLALQPLAGRTFTAAGPAPDGLDVVVLREGYWRETFGGAPLVGQSVLVDDKPRLVLGIISDEQALPAAAEMWMPIEFPKTGRFFYSLSSVARLAPGLSLEAARERLQELSAALQIRTPRGGLLTGTLSSLREMLVRPQESATFSMLAAVLTFLLLACANVAALLATRASVRQREHALCSALGAPRALLLRQSALEALLLSSLGAALGLGLAAFGMRLANREYKEVFANLPAQLDLRVTVAFASVCLVCALSAALGPAWHARLVRPMDALRAEGRSSQGQRERRIREGLVALQVAASWALLVHAGLLIRSVQGLLHVDPGFSTAGVMAAAVLAPLDPSGWPLEFQAGGRPPNGEVEARAQEARATQAVGIVKSVYQRLQQLPETEAACVAKELPYDWFGGSVVMEPEASSGRGPQPVRPHDISPGCLATLRIPLLSGRDLTPEDGLRGGALVALVNQTFAREVLGVEDAVGHRFRIARPPDFPGPRAPWFEIVGMVGDVLEDDLTAPRPAAVYRPLFGDALGISNASSVNFAVAVRSSGALEPLIDALPRAVGEATRNAPVFLVERLSERVERSFADRTALARVLSLFAACALVLAAIGLFSERASEIGIRRALGATRGAILRMILRETTALVALGLAGGVALCWLGRDLLRAFLYEVAPTDPLTYVCVALGLLAVSILAALLAARSAASVSPSRALG